MTELRADGPVIHRECEITECTFGAYTEIGRGSRLSHVTLGHYSYCDRLWDHQRLRAVLGDFRTLPVEASLEKHGG